MKRVVVLGQSSSALHAAAAYARQGHAVRVLAPSSFDEVVVPWGAGAVSWSANAHQEADQGPLIPFPGEGASRGVFGGRGVQALPLTPAVINDLFGISGTAAVGAQVAQNRAKVRIGNVVSLGQECRSYRDWAVSRLGQRVNDDVCSPYARLRFGADSTDLLAHTGWLVHGRGTPDGFKVGSWSPAQRAEARRKVILDAGGDLVEGVEVEQLEVEEGRVVAVLSDQGREHADLVVVDARPHDVARWLPDDQVDSVAAHDLTHIRHAHAIQVTLPARATSLPWELHVVEASRPFWRLTRPGLLPGCAHLIDHITAHLTVGDDDPLWTATDEVLVARVREGLEGIAGHLDGEAIVQRMPWGVPQLQLAGHPCLKRWIERYDRMGILAVGSRATSRLMDDGDEAAFLSAVIAAQPRDGRALNQHDAHRSMFERPVSLPRAARLRQLFAE